MTLVHTPISLNDLKPDLSTMTVEDILGLPEKKILRKKKSAKTFPEPNYRMIDRFLLLIEDLALVVGEMKAPLSKKDRKSLKDLSVKLFRFVEALDLYIGIIEALPEDVPWKQNPEDTLVRLRNRTEDVAEVCELAVDEEFIEMIKDRVQEYLDARPKN